MPVIITIKSRGLTELCRRYHESPAIVQGLITLALTNSAGAVHKKLRTYTQSYPRQRESAYIRTFALMQSVDCKVELNTAWITAGRGIDYASKVWGYDEQLEMHKHMGWWTNKSVAEDMRGVIGKHFVNSAKKMSEYLSGG